MKPEFIDNRELTLLDAIRSHLDWLRETYAKPVELAIATGYFNVDGFSLLADKLEQLVRVRLLLGAEPVPPPTVPLRMPGDPPPDRIETQLLHKQLESTEAGLARDRDILPFAPETERALRRLLTLFDSGRLEVRRYERRFLHGKAFVFADDEGVIAGSSNFTAAGLTANLELNLGRYDPTPVQKVKAWFESLWADAVPYDLRQLYAARFELYEPYLIYLRVLWERYKDELHEESERGLKPIRLTSFQEDGLFRAKRIAEHYHGVLIADGVGLGKTFLAGELIRQAVQERRQRALLVTPAALRDGTWRRFISTHGLFVETRSYEELANDARLGGDRHYLDQDPDSYALVVVDEAQAFRNPETKRARALRRLLQGTPPKTLALLTATPVNNSLWDLYYLMMYFVGHDAAFAGLGIRSLKERFAQAVNQDPDDLKPDILFDVLDVTTVRRTRHFVKRFYPNDRVIGPGGMEIPVQFPEPHVKAVTYSLDDVLPGFFDQFAHAIAPPQGEPPLTLARYTPSRYRHDRAVSVQEEALAGLLRSALLKRFESSAYAFVRTLDRMVAAHDVFLSALDHGVVLTALGIEEWEQVDTDEPLERLVRDTGSSPATDYNVDALRRDVDADRNLLERFADLARGVTRQADPKLARLMQAVAEIADQARAEGTDEAEIRNKRKALIFTHFTDTAEWIHEHLENLVMRDKRLADYRGRIAKVTGGGSDDLSIEDAVFGFVPISSEAPPGRDQDRYDILVATDVLSEGMNLQQCRNLINYDLPWNPMRLVQRHGRIDRIGSPHRDVFVRCFFPDRRLDALLELEERIRRKLAQAAATVGVEAEVIPGAVTSEVIFAESREEIERLRREQADLLINAGEDPAAHSGEEYRQELRRGLELHRSRIEQLPGGAGSGMRGARRGHFFCARIGDRVFLRFVPWDNGPVVSDSLGCLRLIACSETTPAHLPDDLRQSTYAAWHRARRNIWEEWDRATDPAALQPRVRLALREAARHLRRFPPPGMSQADLVRTIESVEAPWGVRIERVIRQAMINGEPVAVSQAIIAAVRDLGLQPFRAPDPLPPIDEEDVRLVCWMAIDV